MMNSWTARVVQQINLAVVCLSMLGMCSKPLFAQAEVSGWGNLRGMRVDGQLVNFTTAVGVFNSDFTQSVLSQREGPIRTHQYLREGASVTVGENLQYPPNRPSTQPATATANRPATNAATARNNGFNRQPPIGFRYTLTYTDSAPGTTDVAVLLTSTAAQEIGGVYYFVTLPSGEFADGTAELIDASTSGKIPLDTADDQGRIVTQICKGIRLASRNEVKIEVMFPQPLEVVVRQNQDREQAKQIQVYFPIVVGNTIAGQTAKAAFTLKAAGKADKSPVTVEIDSSKMGRAWEGIGGNYRIQNLRLDPPHIQYLLDHMRVAYGRVAMPWNTWQPAEDAPPPLTTGNVHPATTQEAGNPMNSVAAAMEIAQKLNEKHMPLIISVWSPPQWAVLPNPEGRRGGGQRLDPAKYDAIAKSLASYLIYLRDRFGVEPGLFSFNESNVGINVKQSPEEHAAAIKVIGAYFQSIGLKTRMLLGDTGDAPPVDFIQVAMNDPEAVRYIAAVSFHSWRGATDEQYQRWEDAAERLGVPLINAEGGNDAQASSYSNIFREAWYSLDEAAEYVRIMRICQPQAILQWQFTENYSVLTNDSNGELIPTQRFYNLKQFNLAPAGSRWLAVQSSSGLVHAAALHDPKSDGHTLHLVNDGAARQTTIRGLPPTVKQLDVYVTDADRGMKAAAPLAITNGSATFPLDPQSLTTLTTQAAQ